MAYEDSLRLLLQNKFDRLENLVQINNQATLAIPSVLVAIWSIDGCLNQFQNLLILCTSSIILLCIWRWYAHYIDNDVVKTYSQIIDFELKLGISKELTLRRYLMEDIWDRQSCNDKKLLRKIEKKMKCFFNIINVEKIQNCKAKLSRLPPKHQANFLKELIKANRIGSRGHDKWDFFALLLISVMMEFFWFHLCGQKNYPITANDVIWSQFLIGMVLIALIIFFNCITTVHQDPSTDEIITVFKKISPEYLTIEKK